MKKLITNLNRWLILSVILLMTYSSNAQIPAGYYDSATGLTGSTLKTALYNIIKNPSVTSYTGLWTAFQTSDRDYYYENDGTVMDIYSENPSGTDSYNFNYTSDQCGTYSVEGDCYNREHSFPKSWFSDASPMYSDLFHIYPTDGKVNGMRSNYPYGEVSSPTYTSDNGSKLGPCSYPGYTSVVFEPIDEFKGDLARTYFYMVTCYENLITGWSSDILDGNTFPGYTTWFLNMLLEWNDLDPVSQKEIDRNNAVYSVQGNRNPYIDHPEYVCLVFSTNCTSTSGLSASSSSLSGFTYIYGSGPSTSQNFTVSGTDLDGTDVTLTAPTDYEISTDNSTFSSSLTLSAYDGTSTTIYVRLISGLAVGTYNSETITISGGGASDITVTLGGYVSLTGGSANIIFTEVVDASAYLASFIEIYNAGSVAEDITGWGVYENGSLVTTIGSITLQPCEYLVLIRGTLTDLEGLYGTYNGDYYIASAGFICNGSDYFELKDASSNLIDNAGSSSSLTTGNYAYERMDAESDGTTISSMWNVMSNRDDATPGEVNVYTMANAGSCSASLLTASPTTLTGFTYVFGSGPSTSQNFTVSGTDLDGTDVTLTAPTDYEISTDNSTFSSSLTLATFDGSSTTIYVRLVSGLAVGTYNSEIITISGGGASDVTVTLSGEVTAVPTPTLTLSSTSLSGFTYVLGSGPSASQNFTVSGSDLDGTNVTLTAPTDYEISTDNSTFSSSLTLSAFDGTSTTIYVRLKSGLSVATYNSEVITISGGGASDVTVTLNGEVTATPTPVLAVSTTSITGYTYVEGSGPSASQNFTVSGTDLDGSDVTLTAPTNYEISTDNSTFSSSLTLSAFDGSSTTIYVRLISGLSAGTYNSEVITISGGGASNVTVSNDGEVTTASGGSGCATDLIISEYGEGSSGNSKYIEIYNGTGSSVDLSNYRLSKITNGGSWDEGTYTFTTATLADGASLVVANNSTDVPSADEYNSTFCSWNGDDAVGLQKNTGSWTLIDAVGTDGTDPGTGWAVAGTSNATVDHYLVRKESITSPNTDWTTSAGTSTTDSEWEIYSYTTGAAQTGHTMSCSSETVDWCNLQWPASGSIRGGNDYNVYAYVYEAGTTDAVGQGANIVAWIGYSLTNNDPATNAADWTWVAATYNADNGNNDEYVANIGPSLTGGTYYYASRFQIDGGAYSYGGYNGGFWDGTTNVSGVLTVDDVVDWANVQYPEDGSILAGASFTVYAQIWEDGYTDGAGQAAYINSWIGYSTVDNDPVANPSDWTWVAATYNTDATNNDEYSLDLGTTIGTAGTYYYVSRFQIGNGSYYYGGYVGGFWSNTYSSGTGNKSGQLIILDPQLTVSPTSLTGFSYIEGAGPSSSQTFTLSGSDLDGTEVTITAPTNYEISTDGTNFYSSLTISYTAPTLSSTTIYVRLIAGLSIGTYNSEIITCSDDGSASDVTVSNDGEVIDPAAVGCASDLIISQVNDNGDDRYIEIANYTGSAVSLADYDLAVYANGVSTVSYTIDLTDASSIADGDVWVLAYSSATTLTPAADQTSGSYTPNGNDVIALRKSSTNIDVFGTIGTSADWYADQEFVRNGNIYGPTTTYNSSEWTISAYSGGAPSTIGTHTMVCTCSEPTTEASDIIISNVSDVSMDISWTSGDGISRIVIAKEGSPVDWTPADNNTYTANSSFGSGTELGTGNYVVYNGSGDSFTVSNLTPGTTYYFKIYEYGCSTGSEDYLTSGSPAEDNATTLPNDVSGFKVVCTTTSSAKLSWDLPSGNYDGIIITALVSASPDDPTCKGSTLDNPVTDYTSADQYCSNASGAVYVFNNVGTGVTITGLTAGQTYYFKAFVYENDAWSAGVEISQAAEVSDVTDLTVFCGNASSEISWTNPNTECFDEVIIAVNTASITGAPSGTYTASSLDYTDGSNPTLSDGSVVVYNGGTSPQTVTGLTNGTTYYFKVFVRSGSDWSAGQEVSCDPSTATYMGYGDLVIVGINTDTDDEDDSNDPDEIQFVCFVDITTGTRIDFTDNGYERLYAGLWADSEGLISITRTGTDIPAGTVLTLQGRNGAANWHVFVGDGTNTHTLVNDDANWTVTDGGTGNNVFDLNVNDQIWMMQGGDWTNPSGIHNSYYDGKVLYGWTAIGWEPEPGYNSTKGSTIFPGSECSQTNVVGVANEDKVRFNGDNTPATQREWISRINNEANWIGSDSTKYYDTTGTLPDVITILGTGFSSISKWTGETSTDWNDCTNWLNLKVPNETANVIFVSDDCSNDIVFQATDTVICHDFTITGSTLTHHISAELGSATLVQIKGDLTISAPDGVLDFDDGTAADDAKIDLYGDWINNTGADGFLEGNSTVEFKGTETQIIISSDPVETFYNLTINNSAATGVTTSVDLVTNGNLSLATGILSLNGFDITINSVYARTNGVFGGSSSSNVYVLGSGTLAPFYFAAPQELNTFEMDRTSQVSLIATNLTMTDLTILNGSVNLAASKYFTVNNVITNSVGTSGLVLKSDATGTASLIHYSENIEATCERYLTGAAWNYLLSPLNAVPGSSLAGSTNPNFYYYTEAPADYWDALTIYGTTGWTAPTGNLDVDKGYIFYPEQSKVFELTGGTLFYDATNQKKVFTTTYTDNGNTPVNQDGVTASWDDFEGWNLFGNPYTAAINWDMVTFSNVENVVYYYDGLAANYKYYGSGINYNQGITVGGGSQFVPANQGFFVKSKANGGTITIPDGARTHNSQVFWKGDTQPEIENILRLSTSVGKYNDETVVLLDKNATNYHDYFDGYKVFSPVKTVPQIYTIDSASSVYALNFSQTEDVKIIPLGVYFKEAGTYTLTATKVNMAKHHVYLKDNEKNTVTSLNDNVEYSFDIDGGDNQTRFELLFNKNRAPYSILPLTNQTVYVYNVLNYEIPDAFTDPDAGDYLTIKATLANGEALPSWLTFENGKFSGTPSEIDTIDVLVTATDKFGESTSLMFSITVLSATSVDIVPENSFKVFPNPASHIVNVELNNIFEECTIYIFDATGKVVYKKQTRTRNNAIDISMLNSGLYFIEVSDDVNFEKQKLIINK